jgi:hypothetical protein
MRLLLIFGISGHFDRSPFGKIREESIPNNQGWKDLAAEKESLFFSGTFYGEVPLVR